MEICILYLKTGAAMEHGSLTHGLLGNHDIMTNQPTDGFEVIGRP